MRPLLPVLLMLLLSSCFTYQHFTLSSEQTTKNEQREIVWENDTVRISFNFNGQWGRFSVNTMNKTDQPISINWMKSAIVYNGEAISLYDQSILVQGDISRNRLYEPRPIHEREEPIATINASFAVPREMDFMPPKSFISRQHIDVSKVVPQLSKISSDIKVEKQSHEGLNIKFRRASYDESTSPLRFQLFFTFTIGTTGKDVNTTHTFYVSEVKQTDEAGPYQVLLSSDGDKFYLRLNE